MDGSSFDIIVQELQAQQQLMEKMRAENRTLQQQITALRTGQSIFLEINGTRMALDAQIAPASATSTPQSPASFTASAPRSTNENKRVDQDQLQVVEQERNQENLKAKDAEILQKTTSAAKPEAAPFKRPSTFLEEIMIDEFASALTAPTAIQQVQAREPKADQEEQKEALRRELIGSFLLE